MVEILGHKIRISSPLFAVIIVCVILTSSLSVVIASGNIPNGNNAIIPADLIDHNSSVNNPLNENVSIQKSYSSNDPSVQLYTENSTTKATTNGWIILNASFNSGGIQYTFKNDKTHNFSFSGVPSGTIFNISGSPNSGYIFDGWKGTINSTERSINVTIASNTVEAALFSKTLSYNVTFTESGLPSGSTWYVNITGQSPSGPLPYSPGTYSVSLPNGSYTYSVSTGNKEYSPSPSSGSFTVNGAAVQDVITFAQVTYSVTFSEAGLPSGATWNVTLNSVEKSSSTSSIVFQEPNGTYSYTVGTYQGYSSSLNTGSVTVSGSARGVSVTFTPVTVKTYSVTFTEYNLPAETEWYVNLTNGQSFSSSSASTSFQEPNGTYSYTIATGDKEYYLPPTPFPPSGSFTVDGSSTGESFVFQLFTYPVYFYESGLPPGAEWYVNITGQSTSGSISTSWSDSLPNGTYTYTASTGDKEYKPSYLGSFTVYGASVSEKITFSGPKLFNVTFSESGLPTGASWSVTLNGTSVSSSLFSMVFSEPNGTYSYSIGQVSGYSSSPSSGSVTVSGSNVDVAIAFTPTTKSTYSVTFTETGLPSGTSWSVTLNGSTQSSATSSIVFDEPNGTYSYFIESVPGWSSTPTAGTVTLNGKESIEITFIIKTYEVTFEETGLQSGTIWYLNLTGYNSSSPIRTSTYSIALVNGTYYYTTSQEENYFASNGSFTVNGKSTVVEIGYEKFALIEIDLQPSTANLLINGNGISTENGIFQEYVKEGYYFINVTESGYTAYSNLIYLSWNETYWQNITLKQIGEYGYLAGTVIPGNATVLANGIPVPVSDGFFNTTLTPGMYYISVTAKGYEGYVTTVNVSLDEATSLEIVLKTTSTSITVSGYIVPSNSSVTVNGLVAYVNSTGFYRVYIPSGNVTVSAYDNGYYSYSVTLNLQSSREINITLAKETQATSVKGENGTIASGYDVTISSITTEKGIITVSYNTTTSGTLVVLLPENEILSATVADLLNSTVFIDGVQYDNFTITITSNGSAILTVYSLSGDPTLYWKYSPAGSVPSYYTVEITESGLPEGTGWYLNLTNGQVFHSSSSTITFRELNGTYSYSTASVTGYNGIPPSGSLTVNGHSVSQTITFTQIINKGYFIGTITPLNASIYINGALYQAVSGQFNISLSPGTYEVKISAPGYTTYTTNITISSSSLCKLPIQSLEKVSKPFTSSILFIIVIIVVVIVAIVASGVLILTRNIKKK